MADGLTGEKFDAILGEIESVLERVEALQGNPVRLSAEEFNLLTQLEAARDFMHAVVGNPSKRSRLQQVFGGDCVRISHLRVLLDERVKLSERNANDQRVVSCRRACESIERVLEDLGLRAALQQALCREEAAIHQRSANSPSVSVTKDADTSNSSEEQPSAFIGKPNFWGAPDVCASRGLVGVDSGQLGQLATLDSCTSQCQSGANVGELNHRATADGFTSSVHCLDDFRQPDNGVPSDTRALDDQTGANGRQLVQLAADCSCASQGQSGVDKRAPNPQASADTCASSNQSHADVGQPNEKRIAYVNKSSDQPRAGMGQPSGHALADSCASTLQRVVDIEKHGKLLTVGKCSSSDQPLVVTGQPDRQATGGSCTLDDQSRADIGQHAQQITTDSLSPGDRPHANRGYVEEGAVDSCPSADQPHARVRQADQKAASDRCATGDQTHADMAQPERGAAAECCAPTEQSSVPTCKANPQSIPDNGVSGDKSPSHDSSAAEGLADGVGPAVAHGVASPGAPAAAKTAQHVIDGTSSGYANVGSGLSASWASARASMQGVYASAATAVHRPPFARPSFAGPSFAGGSFLGASFRGGSSSSSADVVTDSLYDLRVQVRGVSELGAAEYRLGDLTAGLFLNGGTAARLEGVYVEIQLGGRRISTGTGQMDAPARSATFVDARYLLPFRGERELLVRAFDRRKVQAVIRGDPLLGEATVALSEDVLDGKPRSEDVLLKRAGVSTGVTKIWYQALPSSPDDMYVSVGENRSGGDGSDADGHLQDGGDAEHFETPPGTPMN